MINRPILNKETYLNYYLKNNLPSLKEFIIF